MPLVKHLRRAELWLKNIEIDDQITSMQTTHTDRHRQTDRQTDRQTTHTDTHRQTDRQTDRQRVTDRQSRRYLADVVISVSLQYNRDALHQKRTEALTGRARQLYVDTVVRQALLLVLPIYIHTGQLSLLSFTEITVTTKPLMVE